jgi:molybdopterin converting factor small subunit
MTRVDFDTAPSTPFCYVELLGPARLQAGCKQLRLDIADSLTVPELVHALGEMCPALAGPVLNVEGGMLVDGYILNRNGRDFLTDPAEIIRPGDRLLLMSGSAGG